MANLDYRFDDYTEKYDSKMLSRIREYGREHELATPLTIEIGANRGRFIAGLAERYPERHFLGIELRRKFARSGHKRVKRRGLDNADVIAADANLALPILVDDGQIDELFALFPDPWWKTKHHKRRLIQPDFLDLLARKMRPGGHVWIRTDVGPLADDQRKTLGAHPAFEPLPPEEYPLEPFPRSTRERYCIEKGIPINLVYFRRV